MPLLLLMLLLGIGKFHVLLQCNNGYHSSIAAHMLLAFANATLLPLCHNAVTVDAALPC